MRQRFAILLVCTANICRSPLAELLLTARLDQHRFEVASAGILGWEDHPMDVPVKEQARRLGVDPDSFRSRRIVADHLSVADLVLTATRQHRASVLELDPAALRRTFTLREFAELVSQTPGSDLPGMVREVSTRRSSAPKDVDIPDPYRGGGPMHREAADLIDDATRTIADRIGALNRP